MSSDSPACLELRDKIPADWEAGSLDAVTNFQEGPGILAKDFRACGVPLLRLRNIENPTVQIAGCNFLDPEKVASKWNHFRLQQGDLLISTSASLGRVSVVGQEAVGAVAYTGIIRFRSSDERLHHEYLRAFLSSKSFVEQAERMATGSVIKHFGPSHLRQMAITLPPIKEQVFIAELFDVLDDRITLLRETNATLEAIAQALFKSWFVDFDPVRVKSEGLEPQAMDAPTAALFPDSFEESELGLVPKGWRVGTVADLGEVICGKTPPTSQPENYGDDVPFITIPDMHGRLLVTSTNRSLSRLGAETQKKKYLPVGSVCVSCIATPGLVVRVTSDAQTNQQINSVVPFERWGKSFPLFLLRRIGDAVRAGGSGGSVFHNLSKSGFEELKVLLVSDDLAQRFDEIVEPLITKILENQQQSETLTQLRDTLLPRLISGQLRLPEAQAWVAEVG